MTPEFVVDICRKGVQTVLMCAGPMLIAGMTVGLVISILQAATSVNEQTLTFIPKVVAVLVTLLLFGPWIIQIMTTFTIGIFEAVSLQ